jgi:FAD/FMN-containing dehydrogenase
MLLNRAQPRRSNGGIVIDMKSMKGIRVDPDQRTVRAQAGLTWGELDNETQEFGLAVTGGRVTTTGVVGLTLGGGSGWLERKLGLACDNLLRADVVTASGELIRASADENQELFWGLRGGGGNFGVVTDLEFELHPVGPLVYGGVALFPPARAREVVRVWRGVGLESPEELGWATALITAPPEPFVPEEWHGKLMCAIAGMYAGAPADAERFSSRFARSRPSWTFGSRCPTPWCRGSSIPRTRSDGTTTGGRTTSTIVATM